MPQTEKDIQREAARLHEKLGRLNWSKADCELIAPLTLEINRLKKEKNAIILAHSYQTPDIKYGVADFIGDSYGLSKKAMESKADTIVFCSVHFMAETAKILNPEKTVLVPAVAGCSLSESITAKDVKDLRKKYPEAAVVCYINTTAAVKAESDACCTSSNSLKVLETVKRKEIIFIPDELMGKNLQPLTKKKVHLWSGRCIVHEMFTAEMIGSMREEFPDIKVLAHSECKPEVIAVSDMMGGTDAMLKYVAKSSAKRFMLVTECGLTDRAKVEFPDKEFLGTCTLCPYMKKIMLKDVLQALQKPRPSQVIKLPEDTIKKALRTVVRMVKITEKQVMD